MLLPRVLAAPLPPLSCSLAVWLRTRRHRGVHGPREQADAQLDVGAAQAIHRRQDRQQAGACASIVMSDVRDVRCSRVLQWLLMVALAGRTATTTLAACV